MPELKPCPFCKNKKTLSIMPYMTINTRTLEATKSNRVRVSCFKCRAHGPLAGTEEEAAAAWNKRAKHD